MEQPRKMVRGKRMSFKTPIEALTRYPAARRFMAGFDGATLPRAMHELLAQGLAGVAIYPRNFTGVEELTRLTNEIRSAANGPVLIGMDQEGGTRFSLPAPFTQWPSPSELGALGDAKAVREIARAIGRELSAVGCNLNFAPMLDLHLNASSPVTQVRSFAADPALVGRMGAAFLEGLAETGVLGCAKHFPGHGDTYVDPHKNLPIFHGTAERLAQVELIPFAAAIAAGVSAIMTAHILLPEIDADHPASLSRTVLTSILRERMNFQGLILADDLGMGAITKRYAPGEAAIATFAAGTDIAMICHDAAQIPLALDATVRALQEGKLSLEEWESAGERINRVLAKLSQPRITPFDVADCAEHQALSIRLREKIARAN
jgi:beta-N-acetylhexosaminidase